MPFITSTVGSLLIYNTGKVYTLPVHGKTHNDNLKVQVKETSLNYMHSQ